VKILTQDEVEKLQKKVGAGGGDGDNKQQSRDGGGQEDRGADRMGSVDRDQGSMDREMRGPGKKRIIKSTEHGFKLEKLFPDTYIR